MYVLSLTYDAVMLTDNWVNMTERTLRRCHNVFWKVGKSLSRACLAAALGLLVGTVAFHAPTAKAQAGVKVTIEVVKDIRDCATIQAEGSQIVGFSCANNTSGMGNKCWVASVK
jgi:hypothetical protein